MPPSRNQITTLSNIGWAGVNIDGIYIYAPLLVDSEGFLKLDLDYAKRMQDTADKARSEKQVDAGPKSLSKSSGD